MISVLQLAASLIGVYVSYVAFFKWSEKARFERAIQQHGSQPVVRCPSWDPLFGIDVFASIVKADLRGRRSEAYRTLHRKYGRTFEMTTPSGIQLQTSEPENIQAVCTSGFNDFGVGPMRGAIGAPFLDRGIFTEDGAYWKQSRALIRPTFSRAEIADLDNFERHVRRLLALVPRDSGTLDLLPLVKRLVSTLYRF